MRFSHTRSKIVIDIKDDGLRQQLLHKTNLTLLKAVEIGQVHEMANSQLKFIQRGKASHEESAIIDSVKFKRNQNRDNSQRPQYNRYHNDNQAQARGGNQSQPRNRRCGKCATSHKWGQCPAYGKVYGKCKLQHHYAKFCTRSSSSVHVVCADEENNNSDLNTRDDSDSLYVYSVNKSNRSAKELI